MNKPPMKTMVIGHPVIAVPLTLAGGIGLAAALYGGGGLFPALICGGVALGALRANEAAHRYKAWKAEWDAMSPDGPAAPRTGIVKTMLAGILALALLYGVANIPHHFAITIAQGAGYAAGNALRLVHQPLCWVAALALGILIAWLRRRARRVPRPVVVTVIAKAILPVPTLDAAYRALPDYCHALLRGRA